jgi:PmbA protein
LKLIQLEKKMKPASHLAQLGQTEETQLKTLVHDLLKRAKDIGATAAEVDTYISAGYTANVRLGEVDTLEYNRDCSIGITVYLAHSQGSATSTDTQAASIEQAVQAAYQIAKVTQADPHAGLADPALLAYSYPDLDLFHPWNLSVEQAIELAISCETQAMALDKRISNSEGASIASYQTISAYGNSHGFIGAYPTTRHSMNCVLIAQDAKGMQRDYSYTTARDPQDLSSIRDLAKNAAERTVRRLQPRRLKTAKLPVIFAAEVACGLLGHFVGAINGSSLYRNASFLLNQLGKPVFSDLIDIIEQPHLTKAIGSSPYDDEGVALKQRVLVQQGILQGYILSSYSARRLGMQTTGNAGGVHNLTLTPQDKSLADLLKLMGRGLLVTEVMGQGVNIVTGDYSRGAAGFWVENGEIQYPVEEITIAGNLADMLRNIIAVANDVDRRGTIRTGSILIDQMMVAGE